MKSYEEVKARRNQWVLESRNPKLLLRERRALANAAFALSWAMDDGSA